MHDFNNFTRSALSNEAGRKRMLEIHFNNFLGGNCVPACKFVHYEGWEDGCYRFRTINDNLLVLPARRVFRVLDWGTIPPKVYGKSKVRAFLRSIENERRPE